MADREPNDVPPRAANPRPTEDPHAEEHPSTHDEELLNWLGPAFQPLGESDARYFFVRKLMFVRYASADGSDG